MRFAPIFLYMRHIVSATFTMTVLGLSASQTSAQGQAWRPGLPGTTVADAHRYEMESLRARSDANTNLARQQQLNTRLTIQDLQSARQPAPVQPSYRPLRSLDQERVLRQSATQRRERLSQEVGQIDDWLDRPEPDRQPD